MSISKCQQPSNIDVININRVVRIYDASDLIASDEPLSIQEKMELVLALEQINAIEENGRVELHLESLFSKFELLKIRDMLQSRSSDDDETTKLLAKTTMKVLRLLANVQ